MSIMKNVVTVKEVAKRSDVSPATVSRVINNAENVSPAIRKRVQESIQILGYFPNHAARSLVKRRAGSIAVLMRKLHSPYYIDLIQGFEEAAFASKLNVVFCSLGNDQEYRDRYIQYLTNGVSDAIILYGTSFSDQPIIEHLSSVRFPFLLIENNFEMPVNQILINNLDGACTAMEYLINKGHHRIAHFMGDPNKKVHLDRFNGYTQTMQKYGFPIAPDDIRNIYTTYDAAFSAAAEMMQRPVQSRPTAIFATNDQIAAKAISGIQSRGFSVPHDISVMGFDNQRIYSDGYNGPRITSIRQPLYNIGRDSIHILTDILADKVSTPFTKNYELELVELETVCPPPSIV